MYIGCWKLGSFRIFGSADGGRGANWVRFVFFGCWGGRLGSFRIFGSLALVGGGGVPRRFSLREATTRQENRRLI